MAVLLIFFTRKFWRAGKKWRGFRGGNFLPVSRFVFGLFLPAACGGGLKARPVVDEAPLESSHRKHLKNKILSM